MKKSSVLENTSPPGGFVHARDSQESSSLFHTRHDDKTRNLASRAPRCLFGQYSPSLQSGGGRRAAGRGGS